MLTRKSTSQHQEPDWFYFSAGLMHSLCSDYIAVRLLYALEPLTTAMTILPKMLDVVEKAFKVHLSVQTQTETALADARSKYGHNIENLRAACAKFEPAFDHHDIRASTNKKRSRKVMSDWQVLFLALLAPLSALAGPQTAHRSSDDTVRIEEIRFVSHRVKLSGSLVLPRNGRIHAAVVFIHGSGKQTRNMTWGRRFAGEGIAALVYDKRGVGESGGVYEGAQSVSEKNISLLADDAVSALRALTGHPSLQGVPLGLAGISQAGWIAPLAAQRSRHAKFLVLWSAPVCKVSEEDIFSKYTRDADNETIPTYRTALESRTSEYIWPDFLGRDTDSGEDLDRLSIPGLWIFSDNDASIPVDLSIDRLQRLRKRNHAYDYVLFSGLGHNNMEQTFATATSWIRRSIK